MTTHFIFVPVHNGESAAADLNALMRRGHIVQVKREFVEDGANSGWAFCIDRADLNATNTAMPVDMRAPGQLTQSPKADRIDYKERLSEEDFIAYAALRTWRKEVAAADGVPMYAVFTNAQLADIVEKKVTTLTMLDQVEGVGKARVERFGARLLQAIVTVQGSAA